MLFSRIVLIQVQENGRRIPRYNMYRLGARIGGEMNVWDTRSMKEAWRWYGYYKDDGKIQYLKLLF